MTKPLIQKPISSSFSTIAPVVNLTADTVNLTAKQVNAAVKTLSRAQIYTLNERARALCRRYDFHYTVYGGMMSALATQFGVSSYKDIRMDSYKDALIFLKDWAKCRAGKSQVKEVKEVKEVKTAPKPVKKPRWYDTNHTDLPQDPKTCLICSLDEMRRNVKTMKEHINTQEYLIAILEKTEAALAYGEMGFTDTDQEI